MQLRNNSGQQADFYPVRLPFGEVSYRYLLEVLSLNGRTVSKRIFNKTELKNEVNDRVNYGWEVTDFNTIPQLANPVQGAA
tara:strand:+ start:45276 stop:45518 length:243 start_codon:yes stop_codon:yes gene_type:complete